MKFVVPRLVVKVGEVDFLCFVDEPEVINKL